MHVQQGSMPVSSMHTGVLPRCTHCTLVHVLQGAHTYKCAPMQYMHQCTQCAVGQHTYTCLLQGYTLCTHMCYPAACTHVCCPAACTSVCIALLHTHHGMQQGSTLMCMQHSSIHASVRT